MDRYAYVEVPRERWLYADRTMKKWMGWLLSDHSAYMAEEASSERPGPLLPEMTPEDIDEKLQDAWTNSKPVAIQLTALYDGRTLPLIEGAVVGSTNGQVTLMNRDTGKMRTLSTADMRHVDIIKPEHWWAA